MTRAQVRGYASGITVLAIFALAWTSWGLSTDLPAFIAISITAAALLCFLVLLGGAIMIFRRARAVASGADAAIRVKGMGRRFGIIVGAEIVGLVVVFRVLAVTGNERFIPAAVCLGVGIHFVPLRRLFHAPVYNLTAAALCALALATVPVALLTGQTALWTMLPAFGATLTLFTTSALLLHAQHPLRREPATPPPLSAAPDGAVAAPQ